MAEMNEPVMPELQPRPDSPVIVPPWTPPRRRAWRSALIVTFLLLAALSWLLARLIWLPMYFGLFFFLVAGLLISAIAFRVARGARPLSAATILRGATIVSILTIAVTLFWEYQQFAESVGDPPRFSDARNAAILAGKSPMGVSARADAAFKSTLRSDYRPGGLIGYILWSTRAGEMKLTVEGESESITSPHRGLAWPIRTLAATALLAAGLWLGLESLRSLTPTTNTLAPGEEAMEEA